MYFIFSSERRTQLNVKIYYIMDPYILRGDIQIYPQTRNFLILSNNYYVQVVQNNLE